MSNYLASNQSIHELVELQVAKTPDAIAVTFQEQNLTYRELNEKANQLAHYLKSLGVKPEVLVGICVERSLEMIVALLGILKAGGAYVPLDPTYPKERLAFMLKDTQAPVLLSQSHLIESLPQCNAKVVCLDTDWQQINQHSTTNPSIDLSSENLAYVIYTSGSTGKPKGVAMPHGPLVNLLNWQLQNFRFPQAKTLQFTPISFDVSFQEIFSTLSAGGTLVLIADSVRRNAETLLHYLSEQAIERLFLPYIALQHLAEVAKTQTNLPMCLREVITAGEQLKITNSILQWFAQLEDCTLENQYGPSESHVVTAYRLSGSSKEWSHLPPIGQPITNAQIYLLEPNLRRKDDTLKLVATGEPGELAIGGVSLARGYLNRPELTDSKFIPNPFSNEPEARLYKTGDLARYRPDGTIEYIERIDDQVKIRGIRIELGEIEVTLSQHSAVKDAVVVAREDSAGNKRLVAYVVLCAASKTEDKRELELQLRAFLKSKLPDCMIPTAFVFMDVLPLTPSGKVDRRGLPAPRQYRPALKESYVSPRTEVETELAKIWSQVLGIEPVGIYDNFFELGGDSLQIVQVIVKIKNIFQFNIALSAFIENSTIYELAQLIKNQDTKTPHLLSNTSKINLNTEAVLDYSINIEDTTKNLHNEPKNIFITGATGFLGAFLVHELLEQTQANIYCLVRAENSQAASKRLQIHLERYLLWNPSTANRIVPVVGDLSLPLLGCSPEQFQSLANVIDVIYHSGGAVNFIYPYSLLKAPNVLGTQEVLRLASQTKVKPVHYISTIDVVSPISYPKGYIVKEQKVDSIEGLFGYAQSKWVAEKLVETASERGIPTSIYRPAWIGGHTQTGVSNIDFLSSLLKGCIRLGLAPDWNMQVDIVPVDYVSQAIVELSQQTNSCGKVFHITNPLSISWHQLVRYMRNFGYSLQQVSHQEWVAKVIGLAQREPESALAPFITFLSEPVSEQQKSVPEIYFQNNFLQFDCQNTIAGLRNTTLFCPRISEKLLHTYVSHWVDNGFLPMPTTANKDNTVKLTILQRA